MTIFFLSKTSASSRATRDCSAVVLSLAEESSIVGHVSNASCGCLEDRAEDAKEEFSAREASSTVSKKLRMEDSLSCRSTTCGTGADCNVCLLHESGIDISPVAGKLRGARVAGAVEDVAGTCVCTRPASSLSAKPNEGLETTRGAARLCNAFIRVRTADTRSEGGSASGPSSSYLLGQYAGRTCAAGRSTFSLSGPPTSAQQCAPSCC
mmetsp:Transcript_51065/g.119510  ORF Transcript_51065/g.119510 Transcript_51065/m.119510 type:complete len:209 (-) Transcript_51065:77-703(-)